MSLNLIGAYGPWAASLVGDGPAELSYRSHKWESVEQWRAAAREKFKQIFRHGRESTVHPDGGEGCGF